MDGVDYLETVTRRERRGTSHGLIIRVARGVYYRPGTLRSRAVEWEETIHQDTGLLGFTTKHLYFSGSKKKVPPNSRLRAVQRRVRDNERRPDGEAPAIQDRGRVVREQPGHEFGPDVAPALTDGGGTGYRCCGQTRTRRDSGFP